MGGISALLTCYSSHASRETGPAAGRPSDRSPALRDAFLPHPPTLVREPSTTVSTSRSAAEVREWPNRTLLVTHEAVEPARRIGEGVVRERQSSLATRTRLSSGRSTSPSATSRVGGTAAIDAASSPGRPDGYRRGSRCLRAGRGGG